MIVGSTKENSKEKRISITPETSKNIINLGLNISLQEDYGVHLGYSNESYKNVGVKILTTFNYAFYIILKVNSSK